MLFSTIDQAPKPPLSAASFYLLGPLAGLTNRDVVELIEEQGGQVVPSLADADVVVISDQAPPEHLTAVKQAEVQRAIETLSEPQFLQRLLAAEGDEPVCGLQSPSMLAELVGAPTQAIRRWRRRGYLRPSRELGQLPLYDLVEIHVARRLASLLAGGCSLRQIDRLVSELESQATSVERPLAELAVEAHDGRLLIRDQSRLAEPSGQIVLDFDVETSCPAPTAVALSFTADDPPPLAEALRQEAWELADSGDHQAAIEACRVMLLSGQATAEDHFLLAHLLYELGELSAARERYYAAIEQDDTFVEARIQLGCLLAELRDMPVAAAVLEGAVGLAPDLAEPRYHLARILDRLQRPDEAVDHWRRFLELSPQSVWSDEARARLDRGQPPS